MALKVNPKDHDLDFLRNCSDDDLRPLVNIILGPEENGVRKSCRFAAELQRDEAYMRHPQEPSRYVDGLIAEIQKFGGNTIVNLVRRYGVAYRELLCDVAKKIKVNFNTKQSVEFIERKILERILIADMKFARLPEKEKELFFDEFVCGKLHDERMCYLDVGTADVLRKGGCVVIGAAVAIAMPMVGLVIDTVLGLQVLMKAFGQSYSVTMQSVVYVALLRRAKRLGR